MSIEDIRQKARLSLHQALGRQASFYEVGATEPATIKVRWAGDAENVGDLAGTNLSYAETRETPLRITFWRAELGDAGVTLSRGAQVILATDEGYYVDTLDPRHGQTITAHVTPLPQSALNGKELPDGTVIGA